MKYSHLSCSWKFEDGGTTNVKISAGRQCRPKAFGQMVWRKVSTTCHSVAGVNESEYKNYRVCIALVLEVLYSFSNFSCHAARDVWDMRLRAANLKRTAEEQDRSETTYLVSSPQPTHWSMTDSRAKPPVVWFVKMSSVFYWAGTDKCGSAAKAPMTVIKAFQNPFANRLASCLQAKLRMKCKKDNLLWFCCST